MARASSPIAERSGIVALRHAHEMAIHWTKAARSRLLPYPGEPWPLILDLRASTKALGKSVGAVPEQPTLAAELARGLAARLGDRYDEQGNHPHDLLGAHLVDLWCDRRDVVFATEVLIAIARACPTPYALRKDGLPWSRLREHLLSAPADVRAQARALAAAARSEPAGELRPALAYAFCERAWVDEDLDEALRQGYGQLALLACLTEPAAIAGAIERVVETLFQLIEEAVPHMPNVMSRLGDEGASLIVTCAGLAWDKASRVPWLDLVACYDTPEAAAFLAAQRR
ncbi:hypothetical protein ACNOYE_11280 [Nannocystaceae bacterium ST9]